MVALWVRVPSPPGFWERVPNSGKIPRFGRLGSPTQVRVSSGPCLSVPLLPSGKKSSLEQGSLRETATGGGKVTAQEGEEMGEPHPM